MNILKYGRRKRFLFFQRNLIKNRELKQLNQWLVFQPSPKSELRYFNVFSKVKVTTIK